MMTPLEESQEFWMLTKGILQDSKVDLDEARVIKRWLEEHRQDDSCDRVIARLDEYLKDGFIDRFESKTLIDSIGTILSALRRRQQA